MELVLKKKGKCAVLQKGLFSGGDLTLENYLSELILNYSVSLFKSLIL